MSLSVATPFDADDAMQQDTGHESQNNGSNPLVNIPESTDDIEMIEDEENPQYGEDVDVDVDDAMNEDHRSKVQDFKEVDIMDDEPAPPFSGDAEEIELEYDNPDEEIDQDPINDLEEDENGFAEQEIENIEEVAQDEQVNGNPEDENLENEISELENPLTDHADTIQNEEEQVEKEQAEEEKFEQELNIAVGKELIVQLENSNQASETQVVSPPHVEENDDEVNEKEANAEADASDLDQSYEGDTYEPEIPEALFKIPIVIKFGENEFILHDQGQLSNRPLQILSDDSVLSLTLEELAQSLREEFEFKGLNFKQSDELILRFPQLGFFIGEDNYYGKEVSLSEVVQLFVTLRDNLPESYSDVPDHLDLVVDTQPRFISAFNTLSDLVKDSKSLLDLEFWKSSVSDIHDSADSNVDDKARNEGNPVPVDRNEESVRQDEGEEEVKGEDEGGIENKVEVTQESQQVQEADISQVEEDDVAKDIPLDEEAEAQDAEDISHVEEGAEDGDLENGQNNEEEEDDGVDVDEGYDIEEEAEESGDNISSTNQQDPEESQETEGQDVDDIADYDYGQEEDVEEFEEPRESEVAQEGQILEGQDYPDDADDADEETSTKRALTDPGE